MNAPPRVKVCCISSVAEARLAIEFGASALGLVSAMPSGPGVIPDALVAEIAAMVPPAVATFLLTARQDAEAIAEQHRVCGTSTIQLVDSVAPTELRRLRRLLPNVKLVQVVHVMDEEALYEVGAVEEFVDAVLLDSGNPTLEIKELGGTGRVHNWRISRKIRQRSAVPVFLAGGLDVTNVDRAIRIVKPFGVDLCSGVRSRERLDSRKLAAFMTAVRRAR